MKVIDKLREVTQCLKDKGIQYPEKEAEILITHGLNISTVEIYRDNPSINPAQIQRVDSIVKRRLRHEPLQYILGYEEFLGLKLVVGPGVLIPRPETEFMAEYAIKTLITHHSSLNILDLCTGTGCLALAIAKEFPDFKVYGTDISDIAINYANINLEINHIKNVRFLRGRLFQPLREIFNDSCSFEGFDLIILNPPYIKTTEIKNLQPEIREWEPLIAIDGGSDGLDFYREIIPDARCFLKDQGLIMMEVGEGQSSSVIKMLESSGYEGIESIKDYAGIERIVKARCKR
jgi:release factor glutamine methyltransferase